MCRSAQGSYRIRTSIEIACACSGHLVPATSRTKVGSAGKGSTKTIAELSRYEGEQGAFLLCVDLVCEVHDQLMLVRHLVFQACHPLVHQAEEARQLHIAPLVVAGSTGSHSAADRYTKASFFRTAHIIAIHRRAAGSKQPCHKLTVR